jgi:membrane-bound lytic murein transglycosylase MltF
VRLGAQAHQESHLDPSARSARGAVGLLQLLPATAASVGYPDIADPRANILAGAASPDRIRTRHFLDPAIGPDGRIQFALAADNAGPARLRELRRRAQRMGLDPNQWFGNVEREALYVAGEETVGYVANVSRYDLACRLTSDLRTGSE